MYDWAYDFVWSRTFTGIHIDLSQNDLSAIFEMFEVRAQSYNTK